MLFALRAHVGPLSNPIWSWSWSWSWCGHGCGRGRGRGRGNGGVYMSISFGNMSMKGVHI